MLRLEQLRQDEVTPGMDRDTAEKATLSLLDDLESISEGDSNKAYIYGLSAIAAVHILFRSHALDSSFYQSLYDERWQEIVDRFA